MWEAGELRGSGVVSDASARACARVCVDLASLLAPGEGLLVGSFARALALVHSECAASAYIASRPFRVNAGPARPTLPPPKRLGAGSRCSQPAFRGCIV